VHSTLAESGAVWIGSNHPFDLHEAYLCFRSPAGWALKQRPERAELLITADSRYRLWVNGQAVARGPARCYPHAQRVDRLDLTPYLYGGPNHLAVQVYQPGYSHFAYVHRANAGLLALLECDGEPVLVTDDAWRTRRDGSYDDRAPRLSIYQAGVEDRDLSLADAWTAPGYDDSGWAAARVVAAVGDAPWTGLIERRLPLVVQRELPMQPLWVRRGPYPAGQARDPHRALRESWAASQPAAIDVDEGGWSTVSLEIGEAATWVFDLGRGYTCLGWAEVEDAQGGEHLVISYSEKLHGDGPYLSDPETYCRVRMTDRYRLASGDQQIEPFWMRGGRILIFQVAGPTGPDFRVRFGARAAEYPLQVTRPFASDDPVLAGVVRLCENTLRSCLHETFVDNPWRENAQWIGDPTVNALVMAAISDDTRPLRAIVEMAAQGVYPDGVLPGVVPGEAHAYTVVDFNFQWVELLHTYGRLTGDTDLVNALWPVLVKMLDRFALDVAGDGLIRSQPGRRLFLDWAPMSKREPNAIYNLHYVLALQLAVELDDGRPQTADRRPPSAVGRPPSAIVARWRERAAEVQAACRRAFWHDGRWYDDVERTTSSQLATALAILTGTATPAETPALFDALAARSLNPSDDPVAGDLVLASPYMHHRVLEAFRRAGRTQDVIDIIRLRWGRWVEAGYPTAWENWNVDFPDGSQCHGYAAHPLVHLVEIARQQAQK
jgi:hypothetical protein